MAAFELVNVLSNHVLGLHRLVRVEVQVLLIATLNDIFNEAMQCKLRLLGNVIVVVDAFLTLLQFMLYRLCINISRYYYKEPPFHLSNSDVFPWVNTR